MGLVHKRTHLLGPSVQGCRRIRLDAIVAPPELPREIGHRHDLKDSDASISEVLELLCRRRPSPAFGKRPEMHLVDHLAFDPKTTPVPVRPPKCIRIDDLRKSV